MTRLTEKIYKGEILVSDGAWGTYLQQKGLKPGECPELWNIERRKEVLEIAQSYVRAGADMIETNSFGGNSFKLANYNLSNKVTELNKAAAEISREAAGENIFVLGSIGPSGKILMMGEVTEEELYISYMEQAIALENGGADVIIIETFSEIEEAVIAVQAAKENTSCEIICTMTFNPSQDGKSHTMMGVTPETMTNKIIYAGADIIGANCGNGAEKMLSIVNEIRSVNQNVPIIIQANAGMPIYHEDKTIYPETPEESASFVPRLVDAGVNIFGGCCGTTPKHIQAIKNCLTR